MSNSSSSNSSSLNSSGSNSSSQQVKPEITGQSTQQSGEHSEQNVFQLSPLIRLTLLSLYLALTLPLPLLARIKEAAIAPLWLWIGIAIGAIVLHAALSERVILNAQEICVSYPA